MHIMEFIIKQKSKKAHYTRYLFRNLIRHLEIQDKNGWKIVQQNALLNHTCYLVQKAHIGNSSKKILL